MTASEDRVRVLVLTKPFGPLSPERLADVLASAGADGADLVVRDGQTVTPAEPSLLGAVARELSRNGLELDVVTTDLTSPDPPADRILGAARAAGARLVRLGFFRYDASLGYRLCRDQARRGLDGLVQLAGTHGVRLALQLHHGTIHPSAALALDLIRDLDVAVYADPGNQAKEGSEDWRLTLDLLADRIACVGVKNAIWSPSVFGVSPELEPGQTAKNQVPQWHPLADGGVVPWPEIIAGLRSRQYTGPLSVHVHYPSPDPVGAVRRDVGRLREWLD